VTDHSEPENRKKNPREHNNEELKKNTSEGGGEGLDLAEQIRNTKKVRENAPS